MVWFVGVVDYVVFCVFGVEGDVGVGVWCVEVEFGLVAVVG